MAREITRALVDEHRLILRMLDLLEQFAPLTAAGKYGNYQFYLDGVDFIRNFADRFHHAKEEDVLFAALVENGMPRENSPVAAMLQEHDQGRSFVRAMEVATLLALSGDAAQNLTIAENAVGYLQLLREHIAKEDNILYPLAERVIPEGKREGIIIAYGEAEVRTPTAFASRYQAMVAAYEEEARRLAA